MTLDILVKYDTCTCTAVIYVPEVNQCIGLVGQLIIVILIEWFIYKY